MSEQHNLRYARSCGTCKYSVENTNLWEQGDFTCKYQPDVAIYIDQICDKYKKFKEDESK